MSESTPANAEKECRVCGVVLPLSSFYIKNRDTGRRANDCKDCQAAYQRDYRARFIAEFGEDAWRTKNAEKVRRSREKPGGRERGRARTRAWNKAYQALAHAHPTQFEKLLNAELYKAGLL